MSRIQNASKNIKYGYLGTLLKLILQFFSRTVFIYTIGSTYLGVNGLYTNILSVLSFAELGIGTAMNYSLYQPVAEGNKEKIKSLMHLYKNAYRWIALIVAGIGLGMVPFLQYIIKDPGIITSNELIIYYLIFLFNTVSTYFISYKYSLVNAEQKNYIQINIQTVTTTIISIAQIIALFMFKSFFFYLITAAVFELTQKIVTNYYLNKRYPYLKEKDVEPLRDAEIKPIKKNIKALIFHKIGDIAALQTDNILISAFINISTVGIISNYTLLISAISSFINTMFNSLISGFGNLIATEGVDKQYKLFKVYRFAGFWFYGFSSIAFIILLNPFVELWIGHEMLIGNTIIYLIIIDYYSKGHRIVVNNFKLAAGIFEEDKYLAFIRGIVNLIISIIMVKKIGLAGIFVGTIISGLIPSIIRPKIIYKIIFNRSARDYYKDSIIYLLILVIPIAILELLKNIVIIRGGAFSFLILMILVAIVPNLIFVLIFKDREEFKYLLNILNKRVRRGR